MGREEIGKGGQVLARGVASWDENENTSEVVDLSGFTVDPAEPVILSVRNGSSVIDLTAHYGNLRKCTTLADVPTSVACTMNDVAATITSALHGLVVGDAVVFGTTAGGVTAGVLYYVIAVSDANTFQIATARGAAALNINDDVANTYSIAEEHFIQGTLTVEKFAAATSTTPVTGLEEVVVHGVSSPFRVLLTKSTSVAAAFKAYVEIRRA